MNICPGDKICYCNIAIYEMHYLKKKQKYSTIAIPVMLEHIMLLCQHTVHRCTNGHYIMGENTCNTQVYFKGILHFVVRVTFGSADVALPSHYNFSAVQFGSGSSL